MTERKTPLPEEPETPAELHAKAHRTRLHASMLADEQAKRALLAHAADLDVRAAAMGVGEAPKG